MEFFMKEFFIAIEETMAQGYFIVQDTDHRVTTVLYSDGETAWLPGSELAWTPEMVKRRFNIVSKVELAESQYGPYEPAMGRSS